MLADGETRALTPQKMERTEGSNPSLSSQLLTTSWQRLCFVGVAITALTFLIFPDTSPGTFLPRPCQGRA